MQVKVRGKVQVGQGKGELGDPVFVALTLGNVGVEHSIFAIAAHAQNLVVRGNARGHTIHDFAASKQIRHMERVKAQGWEGKGGGEALRIVGHEFEIKYICRSDSVVNDRASAAVVVHISLLLEKSNG